ncbi:MAG: DnaB-like helicase C-terminal domain-containing protein [Elusimicrobiaceae bacterium]|nr:DnaB-like helicase C-terminal domain-containing protein [Elusimicrobiaceae bacterium]
MEYNTTAAFHTRKNNYNSSPIDLATKIHQFCLEDKSVDLWLFSGEVLGKSERKYCNLLSGKYSTHFTHCPSQMEILLFLGKISEMMADSSTVLQTIKRKNGWWMFNLCQYIKIKEDVEKSVSEDKEEKSFANTKRKTDPISSGFEQIDKITGGLKKGEVTLLASRPFKGKTSFALNILHHVCVQGGLATALFSLELPREAIFNKLLAISSRVEINKLINGSLNPQEYKKVMREMQKLTKSPFFIDDSVGILAGEIFSRSKELAENLQKQGKELKLIIIDYLQLIRQGQGPTKLLRKEELAKIVSLLKQMAKTLDVPVLLLSQMDRIDNDLPEDFVKSALQNR